MALGRRILVMSSHEERACYAPLEGEGFILSFSGDLSVVDTIPLEDTPDLLVVDLAVLPLADRRPFVQRCKEAHIPVVGMVPEERGFDVDPTLGVEDFLFCPFTHNELQTRIRRVLWKTGGWDSSQVVRMGELVIDQERYEVSVAGRRIILTYKEYQLLCLLASNPGRVYSREALLSRVWGYDYFGGTRTVDVHIRRLRSKIEDATHLFIETVRNVGYRFQTQSDT
ncbi:MAG: response regulator transcription factor [Chloroflexi bacterium]|nr:response regulator transcription factor [Chloroflexota bacterium]